MVVVNVGFDRNAELELTDLTADHGALSDLQGSGQTWTARLTLPTAGAGTATVTLAADAVPGGNNEVSDSVEWRLPITAMDAQNLVIGIGFNISLDFYAPAGKTIDDARAAGLWE